MLFPTKYKSLIIRKLTQIPKIFFRHSANEVGCFAFDVKQSFDDTKNVHACFKIASLSTLIAEKKRVFCTFCISSGCLKALHQQPTLMAEKVFNKNQTRNCFDIATNKIAIIIDNV